MQQRQDCCKSSNPLGANPSTPDHSLNPDGFKFSDKSPLHGIPWRLLGIWAMLALASPESAWQDIKGRIKSGSNRPKPDRIGSDFFNPNTTSTLPFDRLLSVRYASPFPPYPGQPVLHRLSHRYTKPKNMPSNRQGLVHCHREPTW